MITCEFEDGKRGSLRHVGVNVLVIRKRKILLVKRSEHLVEGGKWCLPGGFSDRNEATSNTALRELREETGWIGQIQGLFCIVSNPNRGDNENRQNIAFCYIINPSKRAGERDKESTDMMWFSFSEIESENIAVDHGRIIKKYEEYLSKPFTLPLLIENNEDY